MVYNHVWCGRVYGFVGRAQRYAGVSLIALASSSLYAPSALAANECGTPVDGVIVCDDASGNPYIDGIRYSSATPLHLHIKNGVVIDRDGTIAEDDAVQLSGEGAGQFLITVDEGVTIKTYRPTDEAIQGQMRNGGTGDMRIDVGGNVEIDYSVVPGGTTGAILGWNRVSNSAGSLDVLQRSSSTFNSRGEEAGGIGALHQGLGGTSIRTEGTIFAEGYFSFGVYA